MFKFSDMFDRYFLKVLNKILTNIQRNKKGKGSELLVNTQKQLRKIVINGFVSIYIFALK